MKGRVTASSTMHSVLDIPEVKRRALPEGSRESDVAGLSQLLKPRFFLLINPERDDLHWPADSRHTYIRNT